MKAIIFCFNYYYLFECWAVLQLQVRFGVLDEKVVKAVALDNCEHHRDKFQSNYQKRKDKKEGYVNLH